MVGVFFNGLKYTAKFYTDLPRILTPVINFTYTVNEDDPVTFNCSASGIPAPTVSWLRVGQNGSATNIDDTRFSISQSQVDDNYELSDGRGTGFLVTSQLAISTTQDEDSGQYQCLAENDVGNTIRDFELIVQSKYSPLMAVYLTLYMHCNKTCMYVNLSLHHHCFVTSQLILSSQWILMMLMSLRECQLHSCVQPLAGHVLASPGTGMAPTTHSWL